METNQNAVSLFRNQKNSPAIRIWHWLSFLGFSASLITVLLGSTMFRTRENISLVTAEVAQKGGSVTKEQAWSVAHAYSDKIWDTHKIIGYILCFLFLSRIIIEIFQKRNERLSVRIQTALLLKPASKIEAMGKAHYLFVKRGYIVFYFLFGAMAVTGLVMAFEDLAFLKPLHKTANSLHSFVQYGIYAYILMHLIGVIRDDLYKNKGIVSGMIHGGNSD